MVFMREMDTELAFEGSAEISNHRDQEKTFQPKKDILVRIYTYINTRFKLLCTSGGRGGLEMFSNLAHLVDRS